MKGQHNLMVAQNITTPVSRMVLCDLDNFRKPYPNTKSKWFKESKFKGIKHVQIMFSLFIFVAEHSNSVQVNSIQFNSVQFI